MIKNVLIILLTILVFSCNTDDDTKIVSIQSILISKDNLYGNGGEGINKQNIVITDDGVWNDLITQMNTINNVSDNFSETEIDFSEYTVIAVFDEIKGNGGHSLELNITSNPENIMVNITDLAPNGNATTVITQPYHIVKIKKTVLPIVFE
ncbi:protease complex subunit PrcB family protein [Aequorivita sp. KMM 9714]|uniref:protease complex subunit PrcB family protein n=1 Tax=Aequorivita sp. KMM 9714 TaxID=2707173 RepID=UPI0019D6C0A1|nr:protease complex subunit PrcB family protein [Aequorivita sp. KMM 9714]